MNEIVNGIMTDYLGDNNTVDYALLLNGPWGCGKSFYVENELKQIIDTLGLKYIYVSLNGCGDFNRIKRSITFQLMYDRKGNSNIDNDLIDGLIDIGRDLSGSESIAGIFEKSGKFFERKRPDQVDISKTVFIFDDLERISGKISHSDIMGAIYENYTKKGGRTVFVTDELNIKDAQYQRIKEKIIRRTITYEPDFTQQVLSFIEHQYDGGKYGAYLDKKKEIFTNYLKIIGVRNLRTIAFIFDNYLALIDHIDEKLVHKHGNFIFVNIMALTEEFKNGNLGIKDLGDTKGLDKITYAPVFWELHKKDGDKKSYAERFYEKYNKKYGLKFIFIHEIFKYVLTGHFNAKVFEDEIKSVFYEDNKSEEEKAVDTIADFRRIEEDELSQALAETAAFLREGAYPLNRLPYIYTVLKFHEQRRYVPVWEYNIEEIVSAAFEKASRNADMVPAGDGNTEFQVFDEHLTGTDFYKNLTEKIGICIEKKKSENRKTAVNRLFDLVIQEDSQAQKLINDYAPSGVFSDIVETDAIGNFLKLSNKGIYFFESYVYGTILQIVDAGKIRCGQKEALEKIAAYISDAVNNGTFSNMRKKRFEEFIDMIRLAVQHLENTSCSRHVSGQLS